MGFSSLRLVSRGDRVECGSAVCAWSPLETDDCMLSLHADCAIVIMSGDWVSSIHVCGWVAFCPGELLSMAPKDLAGHKQLSHKGIHQQCHVSVACTHVSPCSVQAEELLVASHPGFTMNIWKCSLSEFRSSVAIATV